jgi:hypothetical protein
MVAAVVILLDSIRRWTGFGKRPQAIGELTQAEA